jgi:hypothetical protein
LVVDGYTLSADCSMGIYNEIGFACDSVAVLRFVNEVKVNLSLFLTN